MSDARSPVTITVDGGIAVVTIGNPPVNALSQSTRAGLLLAFRSLATNAAVTGIVLTGSGRTFIAGADIREMERPPEDPPLPEIVAAIAACSRPVVAALNGAALGGGLEIALACDLRIAAPGATLGFPEVNLGIVPGSGGTQRLPRLVGIASAIELIATGRAIDASEALSLGLVDRIVEGPFLDTCRAALADATKRRTEDLPVPPSTPAERNAAATAALKRAKSRPAVAAAIDLVTLAGDAPFEIGLAHEREKFLALRASPEAAALRYLFFAERAAARIPDLDGVTPRGVNRVAVIGGGTMGAAIAVASADAGLPVALVEQDAERASSAATRIDDIYRKQVAAGRLADDEAARRRDLIGVGTDWNAVGEADLIIEAVFEDSDVKRDVFRRLGGLAKPGAVLATNTSYADVAAIAEASGRPADVIGLHFFAPANVMRLVEVVRTAETAPDTLATGFAFARRLRKLPILAGNREGFIGNRIFAAYRRQMEYFLLDGATPEAIDTALEGYGFAMGPFGVFDLSGLDIAWAMRKRRAATRDLAERSVAIPDRLCERGWLGRKAGRGFYRYADGRPMTDPEVHALIDAERAIAGVVPRAIPAAEIVSGALAVMANEGAKLLDEGVALRASDIDLVLVNGYGFPASKGGPMHAADRIGLATTLAAMEALHAANGVGSEPAPLLRRFAAGGRTFARR